MDDAFLKRAFAHPRTVELLIRRHLPEWADKVDSATLEPLPTEFIGEKLAQHLTDTAWRVRTLDARSDLVLIIEFQGRPEWDMALRTNIYGSLAAQRLFEGDRELGRGGRGLNVVCLVLHHGDRKWNAPTKLRDLFEHAAPDRYRLVAKLPPDADSSAVPDITQVLFRLTGASAVRRMRAELPVLGRVVKESGDEDFERYMVHTVRRMLRSRGIQNEELERAMSMDAVTVAFRRSLEEFKRESRDEGRREGREQGQVRILRQMAARKFGPEPGEEVARLLAEASDPVTIARISESIIDCDGAEEFLARLRGG